VSLGCCVPCSLNEDYLSSAVIEEFFKNQYSVNQRYAMLNALALGARELASLPISLSTVTSQRDRPLFPSKLLPPNLHQKYITAGDRGSEMHYIVDTIRNYAIDQGGDTRSSGDSRIIRERRLRISVPAKVTEVNPINTTTTSLTRPARTTFIEVAAAYFVAPFIDNFWLFLRDEQAREERTAHRHAYRYHGAGTGLVLNAIVLSRFLTTLAILVDACRNATEWLALVAPDALELAVTLGTKPISQDDGDDEADDDIMNQTNHEHKEASVLTAALDVALIVLDGCLELDSGRSLSLDHTSLLMGAGEWAGLILSQLEKGLLVKGGGAEEEIKLKRTAAGVLLKVDEVTSKWRRSMVVV
jgi:telomere length regulation protein